MDKSRVATRIHQDEFPFDGRGPELRKIWWSSDGSRIEAIDYENPGGGSVAHVEFRGVQAVTITPDEVADHTDSGGLLDLGHSAWMAGLNPHHLTKCRHYRLVFYDQVVDVLCEELSVGDGHYGSSSGSPAD